jgi:RND superfamily putative drug exporter
MRLMGRWNWWAPGFLARLVDRLGFRHVEDDGDVVGRAGRPNAEPTTVARG